MRIPSTSRATRPNGLDDGGSVAKSRLLLSKFITPRRLKTIKRKRDLREARRSSSATTSKSPPREEATSNGVKKLRHRMDRWLKRTLRMAEAQGTTTTRTLVHNWRAKNRGRCGWQLQQSVYKRRDGARGPTLPRKQHAYIYRAAPARVCIAQRPRTYTQPTQLTSCWSTARTHTTRPPRGQASPVFFFAAFCFMCIGE